MLCIQNMMHLDGDTLVFARFKNGRIATCMKLGLIAESPDVLDYKIWDSLSNDFVEIKNITAKPNTTNWIRITIEEDGNRFKNPVTLTCRVTDLHIGDRLPESSYTLWNTKLAKILPPGNVSDGFRELSKLTITNIKPLNMCATAYTIEAETGRFDANGVVISKCQEMQNYLIREVDLYGYDLFVLCLSLDGLEYGLSELESLPEFSNYSGKVLVDMLFLTGDEYNRFLDCTCENGKFNLNKSKIANPDKYFREMTCKFLHDNYDYVKHSILTDAEKECIKNGEIF